MLALIVVVSVWMISELRLLLKRWLDKKSLEASTPEAGQTPCFTRRLTMEEYELQKMETTRKELEKLTASEEFKRMQTSQSRSKKSNAVSRSVLDVDISRLDSLDAEESDLDEHNTTLAPMARDLDISID